MKKFMIVVVLGWAMPAMACISFVRHTDAFRVNMPGKQIINAQTEDLVILPAVYTIDAASKEKVVSTVAYDKSILRLIAEIPMRSEQKAVAGGAAGKYYYFKAIGSGVTDIRLLVKRGASILEDAVQSVTVKERPTVKCM